MRFTKEEFAVMVDELLFRDPVSFDMLCRIAQKTLWPAVTKWCMCEDCLRGRSYEDDIMQEIHLRLMKTTVDYFLRYDAAALTYNNDPEGFERWMFRVAENIKRDFANRVRNRDFKTEDIDDLCVEDTAVTWEDDRQEDIERLKQAFNVVLSSDVGIYKVLTWLAQSVFILRYDVTKIKSNELILAAFEGQTLYSMYAMILEASGNIPWLSVTGQQHARILEALQKKREDGIAYGETKYRDFFMKHNGALSGKKSISDWMNRMNNMLKRSLREPAQSTKKEGRK